MTKNQSMTHLKQLMQFMNMKELRMTCESLGLNPADRKGQLIKRILAFLKDGTTLTKETIPEASRAKKGIRYPLAPKTLILFGNYKNDLATRQFFKKLVGPHFHFTAFGVDWVRERWLAKRPPTYEEFATYWQAEHEIRKNRKAEPKEEWAFLNFIQTSLATHPNMSRSAIMKEWKRLRATQADQAMKLIETIRKK